MVMAAGSGCWHLSRNKMLCFSGALFISIAVCLHLITTPYFPSVSELVASVQSVAIFDNHREDSCIHLVNEVVWDMKPRRPEELNVAEPDGGEASPVVYEKNWRWSKTRKVMGCEFAKLSKGNISKLLNGSWVVVAGDSQARLVVQSLLGLVLDDDADRRMESIKGELFTKHSNYGIVVPELGSLKLDFVWAPYVANLTNLMMRFNQNRSRHYPDVLVMGAGLWDMLHFTNASSYGVDLQSLRSSVVSSSISPGLGTDDHDHGGPVMGGSVSVKSPHLFWLGMPMLINGMLNSGEKRLKMSDQMWHAYDKVLRHSGVLRGRYGGDDGPFRLIDVQSLSWNCGPRCAVDGMRYDGAVYEAAVQILLNALLIESRDQKLAA